MSASFPAPVSNLFNSSSTMYPNQGYNYSDTYPQNYNNPAPGSSFGQQQMQQSNPQQMVKPTYDPRQANGYSYNPNGGPPMMSPSMGPGQYPSQHMRPQPGYYGQQPISQMPPPAMQKTPSSVASAAPMGIPNGMPPMMMQQQGMGQMPTSTAGSTMSMNNQMKSPMPGPNMPGSMTMRQTTTPQMNSPGVFTAPAPRLKQSMPSPNTMMGSMMPGNHPMGGDPSVSSAGQMIQAAQQNQMNSNPQQMKTVSGPPTPDTPFTMVNQYEMPAAFPHYQSEFKKHNPATVQYFDRKRSQLKVTYPLGQMQPPAKEPGTFAFLPGQPHYEEKFDRRNQPTSNPMSSSLMTQGSMIQRQMSAPGITSPSYGQQQLIGTSVPPTNKRSKRSSSTNVEPTPSPYGNQQNRMINNMSSMGAFNNPNLKSPGMMPMAGPMSGMPQSSGMQSMPPSSAAGTSNGMHMMNGPVMTQNGMPSNGMPPSSMSSIPSMSMDSMPQNGMSPHMSNGMPMNNMGSNTMTSNGGFVAPHEMRPPPQYSQMQIPSSSQQNYSNQMQQRFGNGMMSPTHQQPLTSMQQNGSLPGMSLQQPRQPMFTPPLTPCNHCKGAIPPGSPVKICATPSCRRPFHVKCAGLTDAATSMLDTNTEQVGWVCPVCDPRPR